MLREIPSTLAQGKRFAKCLPSKYTARLGSPPLLQSWQPVTPQQHPSCSPLQGFFFFFLTHEVRAFRGTATSTRFIQVSRLPIIRSQRGRDSLLPPAQLLWLLKHTAWEAVPRPAYQSGNAPRGGAHDHARAVPPRRACAVAGLREAGDWYESECVRGGRWPGRAWYYGGRGPEGAGGCAAAAARALGWGLAAPEQRIPVSPRQLRGCRAGSEDAVPLRSPTFFFFLNNRNQ